MNIKKKDIIYRIIKRSKRKKEEIAAKEFDAASVGDVAFLLLIFFVVTGSFLLRQGVTFTLPSDKSVQVDHVVEVNPENKGFYYAGSLVTRERLKKMLGKRLETQKDLVVIIQMKNDIKYDRLVDALSIASELKIRRVSLKNL